MENFNEPSSNPANYKYGVFYYNPKDYRTIVPKRNQAMGWTFNFARHESYLFVLVVMAILYYFHLLP